MIISYKWYEGKEVNIMNKNIKEDLIWIVGLEKVFLV